MIVNDRNVAFLMIKKEKPNAAARKVTKATGNECSFQPIPSVCCRKAVNAANWLWTLIFYTHQHSELLLLLMLQEGSDDPAGELARSMRLKTGLMKPTQCWRAANGI